MSHKICVDCGKEIEELDEYSETCYECQTNAIINFTFMAQNLNQLIDLTLENDKLKDSEKKLRVIALAAGVKILGEEPEYSNEHIEEYIEDNLILTDALNRILEDVEKQTNVHNSTYSWFSYSLIHTIKELGGTPIIQFKDSNFFKYFKF